MTPGIEIVPGRNRLSDWQRIYRDDASVELSRQAVEAIKASADLVGEILASGQAVYGINTGFGTLANRRIAPQDLAALQRNLVLSLTVGVGDPLPAPVVRLILALKVAAIAPGASGIRPFPRTASARIPRASTTSERSRTSRITSPWRPMRRDGFSSR